MIVISRLNAVQVLSELCAISGPFARVLGKLKDELIRSIYSNYYAMEQTGLQFKQLPYYKAAERLEADNKHLAQEKDAFRKVLQRRQVRQFACCNARHQVVPPIQSIVSTPKCMCWAIDLATLHCYCNLTLFSDALFRFTSHTSSISGLQASFMLNCASKGAKCSQEDLSTAAQCRRKWASLRGR